MNQTPNFQLTQWERSDRVLMEDFNADNAKIDAAIKAVDGRVDALSRRSRFTKLWEQTLTGTTTGYTINVGWIDWGRWDKVHLDMKTNFNSTESMFLNSTNGYSLYTTHTMGYFASRATFYVGYAADRLVYARQAINEVSTNFPFSSLSQLIFNSVTFRAGAQFILWGEE